MAFFNKHDLRYTDLMKEELRVPASFVSHDLLSYAQPVMQTPRFGKNTKKSRTDTYFAQTAAILKLPREWTEEWGVAGYDPIAEALQLKRYSSEPNFHFPLCESWSTAVDYLQNQDRRYWFNVGMRDGCQIVLDMDWSKSPGGFFALLLKTTKDFLDRHLYDLEPYFQQFPEVATTAILCCLKEEIRSVEKLNLHKVRLFFPGNKAQYYVNSRYFGEQNLAFVQSNCVRNHHTIGTTKFGAHWDTFIRGFRFPHNFDYDVSGQDIKIQNYDQEQDLYDRMKWYPAEILRDPRHVKRMVSAYYANLFAYVITTTGLVLFLPRSNFSGRNDTTHIGTRTSIRRTVWCFSELTGLVGPECWRELDEHVDFVWNNDDGLFSVSDKYIRVFNCVTISRWYRDRLGVILESAVPWPRPIEDCVFLGNYSKMVFNRWVPWPRSTKVFGSMKKGAKSNDLVVSLTRAAQIYLDQYFNDDVQNVLAFHIQRLLAIAKATGVDKTPEWEVALTQVKSRDEIIDLYLTPRTADQISEVIDSKFFM